MRTLAKKEAKSQIESMDDKSLLLQIALSIVGDSSDYVTMSIDSRVDEVRRVFNQLEMLVEGKDERDTVKTCQ